jgi:hypothetical protein
VRRLKWVEQMRGRIAGTAAAVVCGLLLGAVSAAAAEPTLRITAPTAASYTNQTTPVIAGALEPDEAVWCIVTVKLYAGTVAEGQPAQQVRLPGSDTCTNWQATPEAPLGEGPYTAVAEEERTWLEGFKEVETTVVSPPVTFTVDTTAPAPTISSPSAGSTYLPGSISVSGAAGTEPTDQGNVLVHVFAGKDLTGAPVESVETAASAGAWSGTLAGLAPGAYTLQAQQADQAGNVGTSAPVPITVLAPTPTPPPSASFTWFPEQPRVGEQVTLISSSTDTSSPITSFAWGLTPLEPIRPGHATTTTSFSTPGAHVVRLQVMDAAGRSATASETIAVHHQAATLMEPFPIVRFTGRETARGVKLTLVTVSAPVSARVTVRLRGTGVRTTTQSRVAAASKQSPVPGAALLSFPRFARSLAAGSVLEVRVTKAGQIGKLTRFIPRRGKLPRRTDSCLSTGEKPIVCPAS